ncbi:TrkA family potassium uptake protein [Luteolibacter sp. SL250]|uniref:potassium channel family protein n=1 Tax=Luteolibacter sp. SL250 TaxID=2995170 RepID=UPI00226F667A|nr:TrkA family potassium uptake protein [Luteolibacter sp. SL250]WAC19556.1 TrkA family potassium uptake protein [Luteolibacter sp. SL250]
MKFCIIGLGNFGTQLARQLGRDGHEIVAVDNDPAHIHALKDEIEYIVRADCTDLAAFHEIPVDACDAVILAIGEDFEASLSIAANLQQLGAKRIISRIINPLHGRLLKLLKIDELMIPEAMAAAWLARSLKTPDLIDSLDLGGGYEIAQIITPPPLVGKTLQEAELRSKYDLNLVTIGKSRGAAALSSVRQPISKVLGIPQPDRPFEEDDVMVLFGLGKNLRKMMRDHHP